MCGGFVARNAPNDRGLRGLSEAGATCCQRHRSPTSLHPYLLLPPSGHLRPAPAFVQSDDPLPGVRQHPPIVSRDARFSLHQPLLARNEKRFCLYVPPLSCQTCPQHSLAVVSLPAIGTRLLPIAQCLTNHGLRNDVLL